MSEAHGPERGRPHNATDSLNNELIAFLLARLDEERTAAEAAALTPDGDRIPGWYWCGAGEAVFLDGTATCVATGPWKQPAHRPWARHIARWDPHRALLTCQLLSQLVEQHRDHGATTGDCCPTCAHTGPPTTESGRQPCSTLRDISQLFATHPDYRNEWA